MTLSGIDLSEPFFVGESTDGSVRATIEGNDQLAYSALGQLELPRLGRADPDAWRGKL